MKAFGIIVCMSLMAILSSCTFSAWSGKEYKADNPPVQIKTPNFKDNIYERTKTLNTNANALDINNDMLSFLSEQLKKSSIENTLDSSELQLIITKLDSIVNNNNNSIDKLKENVKPMVDIAYQLNYLETYIKQIEEQNNKILEENKNLRDANTVLTDKVYTLNSNDQAWYGKMWIGVALLGLVLIILGVVMIKSLPKSGISHIGGGILLISLAYFAQKYVWVVAIIGGSGLIGSICTLIYMLFIHKKAIREQAHANEKIKQKEWSDTEDMKNEFDKHHSKTTKELFNIEKVNLKKKGIL